MPVLESASAHDLKRLLELFPISNLREAWPDLKGTKEDICFSVASTRDYEQICRFLEDTFGCCKQHVYIFTHGQEVTQLPAELGGFGVVGTQGPGRALHVIRTTYNVVLKNPLEETTLDFLWPVLLELTSQHLLVRFVVLEKDLNSYFDRQYYVGNRSVEERTILDALAKLNLQPLDLHKGIKKMWEDGFMDSPRAKYKKPISMASEAMDEERGIREYNPQLYETLMESVLYTTAFVIPEEQGCGVSALVTNPSAGYLAFPRYSEKKDGTDFVIGKVLEHNQ